MRTFELKHASCANQEVDVVVNAANRYLASGGGICGVIFSKAGRDELTNECKQLKTPLKDGEVAITSSCKMKNCKAIIHAVGPNFSETPYAMNELFQAYYHALETLHRCHYHSISFPLISSGIFAGNLKDPVKVSASQCFAAYKKFVFEHPDYEVKVLLCAFTNEEYKEASKVVV